MKNIIKFSLLITLFIITGCADTENNGNSNGNNNAGGNYPNHNPNHSGKYLWVETIGKELPADYPVLVEVLNSYIKSSTPLGISLGGDAKNISVTQYNNIKNKLRNYYKTDIGEKCIEPTPSLGTVCSIVISENKNGKIYQLVLNHTEKNRILNISYTILNL